MSTVTRTFAADFPNPAPPEQGEAVYTIGNWIVYALNGQPTAQELADYQNPPDSARVAGIKQDAGRIDLITRLQTATVAQIDTWLTNNVTTLAQARAVLAALIKVIALNNQT